MLHSIDHIVVLVRDLDQASADYARAGFEKIHQEIDEWGIFSVSVARRIRA